MNIHQTRGHRPDIHPTATLLLYIILTDGTVVHT